jgi:hypothetical protein
MGFEYASSDSLMSDLFEIDGPDLDRGYLNLRAGEHAIEHDLREMLQELWTLYEPFADPGFRSGFARDPDARFWEMYLGCRLLRANRQLLPYADRHREGGQPDICVLDEAHGRIWIEATSPDLGQGPDRVIPPVPLNEGGGVVQAPVRQAQLRTSAALWNKTQQFERYVAQGVVAAEEIKAVAINIGRFGIYVFDDPPLIVRTVFPIGDQFVTFNTHTGDIVDQGYEIAPDIERAAGNIPRTAFLDERFNNVSGVIWSRVSIGSVPWERRPLAFVHNPMTLVPMPAEWGVWDEEYAALQHGDVWSVTDILADD